MSDSMERGRSLTLRIEKAIYGGSGLARHEGKAIFAPFTLPGELVTATITNSKRSFAEATLDAVIEPAPIRAAPPCPYFGACGGCHYQHATYQAQLVMKATILQETLTRAGLISLPGIVTHAGAPFGYRNRIRLHVDPQTSALGYRRRGSHQLLTVELCPIAAPELQQALVALRPICASQKTGEYFSQFELSTNHDGSEMLLAAWLQPAASISLAASRLQQLCEALAQLLPALQGAGVHSPAFPETTRRQSKPGSQTRSRREQDGVPDSSSADADPGQLIATWGKPAMNYRAAGLDYRVSLGAFFQVNRTLVDQLVRLATEGRSGALAWDLYAGVGLFSRVLAGQFGHVVAVEGAPISSGDLRFNLAAPHQAVRSSTVDFLRKHAAGHASPRKAGPQHRRAATPDFVLVDPPRAGLGEEVTRLLAQIRPAHVTYVSCDPATLSRDLRALVDSGYQLQQLHLIDLFPQTFHLEAVAMLALG